VVYLTSKNDQSDGITNTISIMDQVNTQFLPHILAIQKGSQVRFPNSDSIKHHVYSFSSTKTFELQLYKELESDPLLFSKPGVVAVGCNIHDWMLGYIFVVDTPYFNKTNIDGNVSLEMPDGEYQLNVWHPRIQDELSTLSRMVTMWNKSEINIILASPLSPDLIKYEDTTDEFSDYE
jgi:plastocyanin